MPTTGKYSHKQYKCRRCGAIESHGTNHWGAIYPRCKSCSWKNPMSPQVTMDCLEPIPEGFDKPEEWKQVKLGDVCEINPKNERNNAMTESNKYEKYGKSSNGNFYAMDTIVNPHPYMITEHHVGWASDKHGGILDSTAIESCEKNGHGCGMKGCNLPYDKHENVLLIACKHPLKVKSDSTDEEMVNPELHEWLMAIKDQVTKDKYIGFAFKDLTNNPNKEIESNG